MIDQPASELQTASDSSLKTLEEISAVLEKEFSRNRRRGWAEFAGDDVVEKNVHLHQAFARYAEVVKGQPNDVYEYIKKHVLDKDPKDPTAGLTPNEWTIFVTGLAFRVLPTISELERRDASLRAAGLNTKAYTSNFADEAGRAGKKSHIQLFFESVRALNKVLEVPLPEDIETYYMIYHLIKMRQQGITFKSPLEPVAESVSLQALYADIEIPKIEFPPVIAEKAKPTSWRSRVGLPTQPNEQSTADIVLQSKLRAAAQKIAQARADKRQAANKHKPVAANRSPEQALEDYQNVVRQDHPTLLDYYIAARQVGLANAEEIKRHQLEWSPAIYADMSHNTTINFDYSESTVNIPERHPPKEALMLASIRAAAHAKASGRAATLDDALEELQVILQTSETLPEQQRMKTQVDANLMKEMTDFFAIVGRKELAKGGLPFEDDFGRKYYTGRGSDRKRNHVQGSLPTTRKEWQDHPANREYERFDHILHTEPYGPVLLPHHMVGIQYDGGAAYGIEDAWKMEQAWNEHPLSVLPGDGFPYLLVEPPTPVPEKVGNYLPKRYRERQFINAQRIAALLPDEIISYLDNTKAAAPATTNKKITVDEITAQLDTLTREGSAAQLSHIDAYHRMVKKMLGCFKDNTERWKALLWSDIHVGKHGVEPDHAKDAREIFLGQMHSCHFAPQMIAEAFDNVVERGYLHNQKYHWEVVTKAMAEAREKALANGESVIKPSTYLSNGFVDFVVGAREHMQGRVANH